MLRERKSWALIWCVGATLLVVIGALTAWSVGLIGVDATHSIAHPPGDDAVFAGSSKVDDAGHLGNLWSIDDLRPLSEVLKDQARWGKRSVPFMASDETKTFTSGEIAWRFAELPDIREDELPRAWDTRQIILSTQKSVLQSLFGEPGFAIGFSKVESHEDGVPLDFARVKDQSCLLVTNMRLTDVINVNGSSSKERVRRVVKQELVPRMLDFKYHLADLNFDRYGLVITYPTAEIGRDGTMRAYSFKGEVACLVLSSDDLEAFVELDISEEELLRRSLVFSSDRDMSLYDIKRIELDE